ncbi:outer membrane beta-barrel domain-containing protein [Methylibium rhizosphaerae]|uniref:outer membrane beta-barrel domain-containing protein n=1 Tax=Methylibium rhizosphaerae TaxID=2570323 RepID=UPI00112CC73F|nr:outer membrane beta-barrel domain-containing protein [Methylibium rhizosphaerae]
MRLHLLTLPLLLAAGVLASPFAAAQNTPAQPAGQQQPANEQVIVPQVDRRDVKLPRFPSKDFEAGLFAGTYQTENFGSNLVTGLRLGYHVTEDFFVEAAYAQTKVSDESFRQILPGGVFGRPEEKLTYYNLSVGYNLLPGEVFIGKSIAKANAIYLIAGIGSTKFNQKSSQTYNFGLGTRLMLKDWAAVQVDLRDHIFSMDLLGQRKSTQNLELTAGITFFF